MDFWKMPLKDLRQAAAEATAQRHGRRVTYVVNRNANFSRICTVGCAFCGFGKRPGTVGATADRIDEVVARVGQTPWVTEVCLQGGIDPGLKPEYYFDLVRALLWLTGSVLIKEISLQLLYLHLKLIMLLHLMMYWQVKLV
jgi:2-iminoacetate synthase ThiH